MSILKAKTIVFGARIIVYCDELKKGKNFEIASQLVRCGTSIGSNVHEANGSESRRDFIHKMKIAYKEAMETEYWLEIIHGVDYLPHNNELKASVQEIIRLLGASIRTAKQKGED